MIVDNAPTNHSYEYICFSQPSPGTPQYLPPLFPESEYYRKAVEIFSSKHHDWYFEKFKGI